MGIKTSIIIPHYNRYDLTYGRLYELTQYIPLKDVEIVVMDDASPNLDIQEGMNWWNKKNPQYDIKYYRNEENLGFGGNCNEGAKVATGEVLMFLSNDVIVTGDFVTPLIRLLAEQDGLALGGGQLVNWKSGWNEIEYDGKEMVIPYIAGWLIACARKIWDLLGGFDPRYGIYDYEDMCLSTTAHSLGIPLVALCQGWNSQYHYLNHISGATIYAMAVDRYSQTVKNKEIFHRKWDGRWGNFIERLSHG